MTCTLQHRQKPPIIIIISGETDRLDDLAESVYQLSRNIIYLLALLAQLVQVIIAIVEPIVITIQKVIEAYQAIDKWLIKNLVYVPVYRGIG